MCNKERLGINEAKQEYAIKLVNQIQEANEYNNLNGSVLEQTYKYSRRSYSSRGRKDNRWRVIV
jgi:hypothetical protein